MNNSPYLFLKDKSQIIIKSSLEIINLNQSAFEIAELYIKNYSSEKIIENLLLRYEVNQKELCEDVNETIFNLEKNGIRPIQNNIDLLEDKRKKIPFT